jgi:hypothetical protein
MGFLDLFRKRPDDQVVVFAGERIEAELVMRMLEEEGFHPIEWADMPATTYVGPIGMARIVVPPEEGEGAKELLAALREGGIEDD